jgi:hypothetical protein
MHFTVQVTKTQHAKLDIEAKDAVEAKLLAREWAGVEVFDEADTEYKYTEPFRVFDFVTLDDDTDCDYCGEATCHYDCDESQAEGFPQ